MIDEELISSAIAPMDDATAALKVAAASGAVVTVAAAPLHVPSAAPTSHTRKKAPWRSTNEEFGAERAAMRAELDAMLADARTPFFDDGRAQRINREITDGRARLRLRGAGTTTGGTR